MTPLFASRNPHTSGLSRTLARLAPTDLTILLEGETGTGKSFAAARLHRRGRPGRPIVVVDCGAVPETLLASELFGHRAGAFTDATRARAGACDRAGEGTLVLDRIDALSSTGQTALLRLLEERRFVPVGASTTRALRARVVALAGPDLLARMSRGEFRADLFHRLNGFHAVLPPLRHRPEDIVPFGRSVVRRAGAGRLRLDSEAEGWLEAYPWPGNFRELRTVLERSCLIAGGPIISVAEVGLPVAGWAAVQESALARALPLAEVERLYGLAMLAREGGNVSRAARILGISRRTLIRWRRES
ncbi:MAG: sigma-54-dependent transcriptional regulator [Acidobacteriota bacterium]